VGATFVTPAGGGRNAPAVPDHGDYGIYCGQALHTARDLGHELLSLAEQDGDRCCSYKRIGRSVSRCIVRSARLGRRGQSRSCRTAHPFATHHPGVQCMASLAQLCGAWLSDRPDGSRSGLLIPEAYTNAQLPHVYATRYLWGETPTSLQIPWSLDQARVRFLTVATLVQGWSLSRRERGRCDGLGCDPWLPRKMMRPCLPLLAEA
jgi:hypothetical protein